MGEAKRRKTQELPPPGQFEPRVSQREARRRKEARTFEQDVQGDLDMLDYIEAAEHEKEHDVRAVSIVLFWSLLMLVLVGIAAFAILYTRAH